MSLQDELGLQQPFKDQRHETVLSIVRTANLISAIGGQLFREFGLTEAQFNVLFALKFTTGDITQAELGKRLVVTRASITSVLDKLEGKNLVTRNDVPGNRRIHHVRLTPEGIDLINNVERPYREVIYKMIAELSDGDCKTVIELMQRTRDRIRAEISENSSGSN